MSRTALLRGRLDTMKYLLRLRALRQWHDIRPLAGRRSLRDCYTVAKTKSGPFLVFWFNVASGSTHIVREQLPEDLAAVVTPCADLDTSLCAREAA